MTKDVLITVKGMQAIEAGEKPEEVEVVAKGLLLQERPSFHLL